MKNCVWRRNPSADRKDAEIQMALSPKGTDFITSACPGVGSDHEARLAYRDLDPYHMQPRESPKLATRDRADEDLIVTAKKPARILLVDAARALQELHLLLLRSIPAVVETLPSCIDMYLHEEHDYTLVMLVLHSCSKETAEAAHFVRHRWNSARILLLEGAPTAIDDWLYDERIDPYLDPVKIRDAVLRLMTEKR
jgi:hypothetical protein